MQYLQLRLVHIILFLIQALMQLCMVMAMKVMAIMQALALKHLFNAFRYKILMLHHVHRKHAGQRLFKISVSFVLSARKIIS